MTPDTLSAPLLEAVLSEAGLTVPDGAVEKLLRHAAEMLQWNRSIRLTAITDPLEVAVKHVADSLFLLKFAPFPGLTMDFGSGAGYPGIPLAAALPESRFVLVDSSAKKCAFLSRVRSILPLENVEVVRARLDAETALPVGPFEGIVTRATLDPNAAAALLLPRLAPGGRLLLMTGPEGGDRRARGRDTRPGKPAAVPTRRAIFHLPRRMGERVILEYAA